LSSLLNCGLKISQKTLSDSVLANNSSLKKLFVRPIESPAVLLLLTGSLLGLTFPLGKLANQALVSPLIWAWLVSTGAGVVLLLIRFLNGKGISLGSVYYRYYLISSVLSLVIPNLLIFNVIPKLGSGFTGILFTLTPVITLAMSIVLRVRVPGTIGICGIAIGLIGAVIVTTTRGEVNQPAALVWILAGLCIPLSLAAGNIYRTVAWPEDAEPLELATGSNLSAGILLTMLIIASSQLIQIQDLLSIQSVAIAQVIAASAMFGLFYKLQQVGGPTYLSQISYVAAGVALFSGTLFLDERYSVVTWLGAVVIVFGIVLGVIGEQRRAH